MQVVVSDEFINNGKKSISIDFNVAEDSLMAKRIQKPIVKDKAFLWGVVFIGVFITISTLIWGIL